MRYLHEYFLRICLGVAAHVNFTRAPRQRDSRLFVIFLFYIFLCSVCTEKLFSLKLFSIKWPETRERELGNVKGINFNQCSNM